ncbi:zinc ribbon domain-containing protein [Halosimplex marinum]|uniref:zinc ribbon domain-containing protein n=1 Tax=Halosimplex marinum TaxID=3396620 RepID=UPI003F567F41
MAVRCSNCGTQVRSSASECPSCGAVFEEAKGNIPERIPASWIGGAIGLLVYGLLQTFVPTYFTIAAAAAVTLITWVSVSRAR